MKHTIEVDVPEGYKAVKYDYVRTGELYIGDDGEVEEWLYTPRAGVKCIVIEEIVKQGEELVGCLCGFSDKSLKSAKCYADAWRGKGIFVDVVKGISHDGYYNTVCGGCYTYAYPVSKEKLEQLIKNLEE
jgi:hypothetical protein